MKPKPRRKGGGKGTTGDNKRMKRHGRVRKIKVPKFDYKTKCTVKGCKASIKKGDEIWSFSLKKRPELGIVGRCKKHLKVKYTDKIPSSQETNRASKDRSPR